MEKDGGILLLLNIASFCEIHGAVFPTLYRDKNKLYQWWTEIQRQG